MIWFSERERTTVAVLGTIAVVLVAAHLWQRRHEPLAAGPGPTPPYAQWEQMVRASRRIDVNRATAEELAELPQIGPTTAQHIVAYRAAHGAFRSPDDLLAVPGIGPKTRDAVADYVAFDAQPGN